MAQRSAEEKPAYLTETEIKKRKATPLKKQILAQREEAPPNPLWMKFGEHLQKFKEEQAEKKVEKRETKDDLNADGQLVPFGLADRCYLSDTEDCSKAQRHIETSHCGFREVARLIAHKSVTALIIAPDVERTSAGALEEKVLGMKNQCDHDGVPVIFALSRRQLGAAIQK